MDVKLLISDFDGTLVDTFEANYLAYSDTFEAVGLSLGREQYKECFGLRFDNFMSAMEIDDVRLRRTIKELKAEYYPLHFDRLRINRPLIEFFRSFHRSGGKTAIASTAREKNLRNALRFIGADNDFDLILAGESVGKGKPDPEIYLRVLQHFTCNPEDAIVFEDSEVGFKAAENAGIRYIKVTKEFFDNGI